MFTTRDLGSLSNGALSIPTTHPFPSSTIILILSTSSHLWPRLRLALLPISMSFLFGSVAELHDEVIFQNQVFLHVHRGGAVERIGSVGVRCGRRGRSWGWYWYWCSGRQLCGHCCFCAEKFCLVAEWLSVACDPRAGLWGLLLWCILFCFYLNSDVFAGRLNCGADFCLFVCFVFLFWSWVEVGNLNIQPKISI